MQLVRTASILWLLASAPFFGCRPSESASLPTRSLEPVLAVEDFEDSRFLANVTGLYTTEDTLFCVDKLAFERLLLLDHQLELMAAFGRKGEGPGEVGNVRMGAVFRNSFFVYDPSHRAMQVFDSAGRFVQEIDLPLGTRNPFTMDREGRFYFSTYHKDQPITQLDADGQLIRAFGTWYYPTEDRKQRRARNGRFLVITADDQLVSIGETEPIIEIYSTEGELIASETLRGGPRLARRIAYIEEAYRNPEKRHVSILLSEQAWHHGDRLYLAHYQEPGKGLCITAFRQEGNRFVAAEEILLTSGLENDPDPIITPAAMSPDGTLFAYDRRLNRLYRYDPID